MDFIVAGAGIDDRALDVLSLVEGEELFEVAAGIGFVFLVGGVPDQAGEFVAVEIQRVSEGDGIGDGTAAAVQVAAQEEDAVVSSAAIESIGEGGDDGTVAARDNGEGIGNDLEGIVARFAEEKIAGLAIETAGEDIVAVAAKDQSSPLPPESTSSPVPPRMMSRRRMRVWLETLVETGLVVTAKASW